VTITATGIETKPMRGLAVLVAACSQFQADCGADTAATALESVHWPEAEDEDATRPRAVVRFGSDLGTDRQGPGTWVENGSLVLSFEYPLVDATASESDQLAIFANSIGTILDQMRALEGQGDAGDGNSYLHVVGINRIDGPGKCNPQQEGGAHFFGVSYNVRWMG
jgi:hypothetical protein